MYIHSLDAGVVKVLYLHITFQVTAGFVHSFVTLPILFTFLLGFHQRKCSTIQSGKKLFLPVRHKKLLVLQGRGRKDPVKLLWIPLLKKERLL